MAGEQWRARWHAVIDQLQVIQDDEAAERLLQGLAAPVAPTVLGFVNAHAMNLIVSDDAYGEALLGPMCCCAMARAWRCCTGSLGWRQG